LSSKSGLMVRGVLFSASCSFLALWKNISSALGGVSFQELTAFGLLASIAFGALVTWDSVSFKGTEKTSSHQMTSLPVLATDQSSVPN
jgi:hypothetical protein